MAGHSSVEQPGVTRKWWILIGVSLGVFMSVLDTSVVNIALPTLVQSFQTTFATVQWVILSYLLVITSLLLGVARLGDMIGKKPIYLTGLALFSIGSLLCGLAPDIGWLIGFRALQGLGAVMMTSLGVAIIFENFPFSEQGRAMGVIGGVISAGIALGPSVGGVLIGRLGWQSIFLINVPIGLVAAVLIARSLPTPKRGPAGQRFDVPGALIMMVTLVCYAIGMTRGQSFGFGDGRAVALLGGAAIGLAVFLFIQMRSSQPMIDLGMFRNEMFSLNLLLCLLAFIAYIPNLLILPFFLERVKGYSPETAGLLLAAIPVISALIAPVSGMLTDRYGPALISVAGLVLVVIGYVVLATLSADVGMLGFVLISAPAGIGWGIFQTPNNSAVMASAPPERMGVASGLLALGRTLGQTSGVPLMGALFAGQVLALSGADVNAAPVDALVAGVQVTFRVTALITLLMLAIAGAALWRSRRRLAAAPALATPQE